MESPDNRATRKALAEEPIGADQGAVPLPSILRSHKVRGVIANVIHVETGADPLRSASGSVARIAYARALEILKTELVERWCALQPGAAVPDARALAFIAASRACSQTLQGRDAWRARLRSQIRCILALTPGFALWAVDKEGASPSQRRRGQAPVASVGGRLIWRQENRLPVPVAPMSLAPLPLRPATFDQVREAVLERATASGGPVAVEDLVAALDLWAGPDDPIDHPPDPRRRRIARTLSGSAAP